MPKIRHIATQLVTNSVRKGACTGDGRGVKKLAGWLVNLPPAGVVLMIFFFYGFPTRAGDWPAGARIRVIGGGGNRLIGRHT